jgi:TnpA family transposase
MPRRSILTAAERDSLLAWPEAQAELIRHYTLSATDLAIIRQHRGAANRLGYAVQLCYMRYPGVALGTRDEPFVPLLQMVAAQLRVPVESWAEYGRRAETRREHALELQAIFGFKPFTMRHYRAGIRNLEDLAWQTDKGIVLASALIEEYRQKQVLLPTLNNIERICAEAVTRTTRSIYVALTRSLADVHRERLDDLLRRKESSKTTLLAWLRQSPAKPNSRHMLEHIERLRALQALDLPSGIERQIHQNRLLKIAREGGQMTPADLAKFEPQRRYATLVAVVVEATATITDEIIDLHDRIVGEAVQRRKA